LSALDVNLVEANSGKEALRMLLELEFAAILLDVMMPEMDGFETARLIRGSEKLRHTPIIFITAMFLNDADAFKGYSVGAVDYIMKPFVPEILRSKVQVFVDLHKKTQEIKRQTEVIRLSEQREYQAKLDQTTRTLQAETERERVEHRAVRSMVQHAPLGFARLDYNRVITDINPIFIEHFKLPDGELNGRHLQELMPWLPQQFMAAIGKNQPFHFNKLKVQPEHETHPRFYDLATWPIVDATGSSKEGSILLSVDVTERVQLDQQRDDFVATLAHDLQTPVIAADRALNLLVDRASDNLGTEMLNLVSGLKKNNENLLHMIESLLDIYHYEEGARALYVDEVDVRLLVRTIVEELTPLAEQQGLMLMSKQSRKNVMAAADRTAIRRVITNLIDNALKFTPKGGTVEVGVSSDEEQAIIEVIDSGCGIAPEDQNRIFERYWHGSGGPTTMKKSRGLGLYLCRQIIDAHEGRIECSSELGKMTKFTVYLPLVREADSSLQPPAATSPALNVEAS
jgi:signal transduction histidine kinase